MKQLNNLRLELKRCQEFDTNESHYLATLLMKQIKKLKRYEIKSQKESQTKLNF